MSDEVDALSAAVRFSVVVPVYRSVETLEDLHRRIVGVLEPLGYPFEILLVEDRGPDSSWEVIQAIARGDDRVRGYRLTRNFGQHAATLCGIANARGAFVITLDDDLEQRPEDIPLLLKRAGDGYAIVYGVYPQRTHSLWRNLTSAIARRLFRLAIPSLNYEYTSFRVMDGKIARALIAFDSPFPFIDGYLSWLTSNYAAVPVTHERRLNGTSTYTIRKLLTHSINIFVTFSDLPLRIASWLGIGTFLVGMSWLVGIILARLLGGITVSGFASVMAAITLFGGIQLLILGVMGEYLGRMNF